MTEHEVAFLEATKLKYMYSKHLSFINFIKYENIEFPDTLKADSFLHWNAEKRK